MTGSHSCAQASDTVNVNSLSNVIELLLFMGFIIW